MHLITHLLKLVVIALAFLAELGAGDFVRVTVGLVVEEEAVLLSPPISQVSDRAATPLVTDDGVRRLVFSRKCGCGAEFALSSELSLLAVLFAARLRRGPRVPAPRLLPDPRAPGVEVLVLEAG